MDRHTIAGKVPKIETGRRNLRHDWTDESSCFKRVLEQLRESGPRGSSRDQKKARGTPNQGSGRKLGVAPEAS